MLYRIQLLKNQKGSTPYPMTLYKRDSTADIFHGIFNIFFGQAISHSSEPLIAQGQLSYCNGRNTVMTAVVKSHKGLKGTKDTTLTSLEAASRSSRLDVFCKKGVLRNSQENTCARVSILKKLQACLQLY